MCPLRPLSCTIFHPAARAENLLAGSQYYSENRAILTVVGDESGNAVSTDASWPHWRLVAQVLATLRVVLRGCGAELAGWDFGCDVACGGLDRFEMESVNDFGGVCVDWANGDGVVGGDGGASDARCSASCVSCGRAYRGPGWRNAHPLGNGDCVGGVRRDYVVG